MVSSLDIEPPAISPTVVVLPCSKEKRWLVEPERGAVVASAAYISPLHLAAQAYAQSSGNDWLILSALHGLLRPDDLVPSDYDVTFSRPDDPVISTDDLAAQVHRRGFDAAQQVISLCPDDYTERLRAAFGAIPVNAPLAGIALHDLAAMTRQISALTAQLDGAAGRSA